MRKPKNKITAWSYSRYSTYKTCPFKLKCSAILKIKEPPNIWMDRGTDIHNKGERYLLGDIHGVPPEFKDFKEEIQTIKAMGALPEVDLATTKYFEGPTAGDDWDHVWCRAKVDADVPHENEWESTLIDYKTGKPYPSHEDQGEVYALSKMVHDEIIEVVDVEFWYLDRGEVAAFQYTADDFDDLCEKWIDATEPMLMDTKFIPTPGEQCKKCFYSKRKNGPCKY